jgi:hypothetical protein
LKDASEFKKRDPEKFAMRVSSLSRDGRNFLQGLNGTGDMLSMLEQDLEISCHLLAEEGLPSPRSYPNQRNS